MDNNDMVMIELDRPRELKLSHKALKRFSSLTDCSMADLDSAIMHYDKMATLMYVMLAVDAEKHGETLTPDQADDLLENVPLWKQFELCGRAMEAAMTDPNAPKKDSREDPTMAAGAGVTA